jgi:hypothetical protein
LLLFSARTVIAVTSYGETRRRDLATLDKG